MRAERGLDELRGREGRCLKSMHALIYKSCTSGPLTLQYTVSSELWCYPPSQPQCNAETFHLKRRRRGRKTERVVGEGTHTHTPSCEFRCSRLKNYVCRGEGMVSSVRSNCSTYCISKEYPNRSPQSLYYNSTIAIIAPPELGSTHPLFLVILCSHVRPASFWILL